MKRIILLIVLFLMALVGLIVHYTIHPFMMADHFSGTFFLANILPFLDVVLVTILFLSRKTALYGYLLNGLIVIFGTILMAHFNIADLMANPIPPSQWVMNSMLVSIGITWVDFFVGRSLYNFYLGRK
jgi:hypothetical protein